MAYRLAAFVERTSDVKALLARLSPEDVDWWEAFDALEPIGTNRLYELLAQLGSAIYGSQGTDVDPRKFVPWLEEPQSRRTGEQELASVRAAVIQMSGA